MIADPAEGRSGDPVERPGVFVSYAREDLERARRIVLALQFLPVALFWDQHLQAGDAVEEALQVELDRASCVVVLWSEHSVGSKWVQLEAAEADDRDVIVPVRLDSTQLPLRHRRRQNVDFTEWSGDPGDDHAGQLRQAVQATISRQRPRLIVSEDRAAIAEVLRRRPGKRGVNLMKADLAELDLHEAQLLGANLVGASLRGADLRDADLLGANLERADLRDAQLSGANLRRVNLWHADVSGAKGLLLADLSEANAYRTSGLVVSVAASGSKSKILSLPDYQSFIDHYVNDVGLEGQALFDMFPWLAHRYFIGLLGN